jgi:hypothetical protein
MSAILGKGCRVLVEFPDGRVLGGDAVVANLTMTTNSFPVHQRNEEMNYLSAMKEWEVQLIGTGEIMEHAEFETRLYTAQTVNEWKCPYCGIANPKLNRKCDGCNAWRPFLLVS